MIFAIVYVIYEHQEIDTQLNMIECTKQENRSICIWLQTITVT